MKKVELRDGITLFRGDCMDVMPLLADDSVGAAIADPPYGINAAHWDNDMPSQRILNNCLRISAGPVVWFGSASKMLDFADYHPRPERMLIWAPKFSMSHATKNGFFYRYHVIAIWRSKDQKVIHTDVLDDMTERSRTWWNHKGTKPRSLMRKLVAAFVDADAAVLDPFMGSGTTGVAAVQTGRRFIGIEIDEEYFNICIKRMKNALMQPLLITEKRCESKMEQKRLDDVLEVHKK